MILETYQNNPVVKILLMTTGTGAFGLVSEDSLNPCH
jgi:hypothetical protein